MRRFAVKGNASQQNAFARSASKLGKGNGFRKLSLDEPSQIGKSGFNLIAAGSALNLLVIGSIRLAPVFEVRHLLNTIML
jgi:hypothetical protein